MKRIMMFEENVSVIVKILDKRIDDNGEPN
jgi:hypothetical protein